MAGVGLGLGMSLIAVRFLRSMLWRARDGPGHVRGDRRDLLVVAALASLAPALRILRMDPAETLRNE